MRAITGLIDHLVKDNVSIALIKIGALHPGEYDYGTPVPTPSIEMLKEHRAMIRREIDEYFMALEEGGNV